VDQQQLKGEHDFRHPRDIDELCLARLDKHCCVNVSTDRLTTIPSQGCDITVGIVRGNPGVSQGYPYPTLQIPLPPTRVRVFEG